MSKLVVAKDKTGDFNTIQAAIDKIPENNIYPIEIFIKQGIYREVINIPAEKQFIKLIGEDKFKTVISYDNFNGKLKEDGTKYGTTGSSTAFLYADNFQAENLTFANTHLRDQYQDDGSQAVAVKSQGDKMVFKNVRFLGHQDTLYANQGRQYFSDCYIEGDVDFIFGAAQAVFENCQIHSLDRNKDINGYITAASTSINDAYGFLFIDCEFTADTAADTVYLGRPWHPGGDPDAIAAVVIRDSQLGKHIKKAGWTQMSGFSPAEARLFEYNNYGPGAVTNSSRRTLTEKQAQEFTIKDVLKDWKPQIK